MTKLLMSALCAALLLTACGSGGSSLIGTWALDADALEEMPDFKDMPEDQQKMAKAFMAMMKIEITFTADKLKASVEAMGQNESYEADYTATSKGANKWEIKTTDEKGEPKTFTAEVKGDLLFMSDGEQKLALRRQ